MLSVEGRPALASPDALSKWWQHRALVSLLMAEHDDSEPTQKTRPKKGKPVEIPVPKKGDVMSFLEKAAKTPDPERPVRAEPVEDDPAPPHGDPLKTN